MTYELQLSQFGSVRQLINEHSPQFPISLAIIEGKIPGKVWVDNLENPKSCLIASNFVFTFLAGKPDENTFKEFLNILQKEPRPFNRKLECPADFNPDFLKPEFLKKIASQELQTSKRHQFLYPKEQKPTITEIPKEFKLEPITANSFAQTQWGKPAFEPTYGTVANYIQNTLSFCLHHEGKIIGELHGMVGGNYVLLGGIALPEYRRQHLGWMGCNYFVDACRKQGKEPVYTCDVSNIASHGLAEKSGFHRDIEYSIIILPATLLPAQLSTSSSAIFKTTTSSSTTSTTSGNNNQPPTKST